MRSHSPALRRVTFIAVAAIAVTLCAVFLTAQSATLDPRIAEFNPSPDHSANGPDGEPLVTRYDLEFYLVGAILPFQTTDLGKPAPEADGKIRVTFTTLLTGWPLPGTPYEARIAAVGPGGAGRSDVSNQFIFTAQCTATITPSSAIVSSASATGTISVQAPSGCAWTATSSASWLVVTAGATGTGNGSVSYSVAANTATTARTATITAAGQEFVLTQTGLCTYTVSPATHTIQPSGGSGTVSVTTQSGCSWTAVSNHPWISIVSGGAGSGSGTVTFQASANGSGASRSGTLTVAGQLVTITQVPLSPPPAAPTGVRVIR
jgi:hypothetical protein